jgi:dienelactone hydrolase
MTVRLLVVALFAVGCAHHSPAPPPAPAAPPAPNFSYDASAPLDVHDDGPPDHFEGVVVQRVSYASPRGGRVPALLVTPADAQGQRRRAVVLQHGMGLDKTELLPDAIELARSGAIALLPDSPDQRPTAMRVLSFADHEHDRELWEQAAVDLRRAVDVLVARSDVDPQRLGFVGHSFGASMGAVLAAVEPRMRALVLVGAGNFTRGIREGSSEGMVNLRATIPKPALERYLASLAPFDADRFLARAPKTTAILFQFGTYDANSSRRADDELAAACTATTQARTYPTGHFITSPAALRDRLGFLDEILK